MSKIWTWISCCAILLCVFCMAKHALNDDIATASAFGVLALYNICFIMARIEREA